MGKKIWEVQEQIIGEFFEHKGSSLARVQRSAFTQAFLVCLISASSWIIYTHFHFLDKQTADRESTHN